MQLHCQTQYLEKNLHQRVGTYPALMSGQPLKTILSLMAVGNDQSLNNSSGFNAFPEGFRFMGGSFSYEGSNAIFWSSTENFPDYAWYRYLTYDYSYLSSYNQINERSGCSVRFIRN